LWASRLKLARLVLRHRGILCRSRCSRRLKDPPQVPHRAAKADGTNVAALSFRRPLPSVYRANSRTPLLSRHFFHPSRRLSRFTLAIGFLLCVAPATWVVTAGASAPAPHAAEFIVSACNGPNGGIWLATEGRGIFRYNSQLGSGWQNFAIGTAVNHNVADAVACDTQGRIWVGSLNEGAFVFLPSRDEGQPMRMERYGLLTDPANNELAGPIGEHVYSINVDPVDGSVWICTNSGVSRYEPGHGKVRGSWAYYDVASGLPSDDIQCVAFGRHGRAYVATTCNGIAISRPTRQGRRQNKKTKGQSALHYRRWRVVASSFVNHPPLTPVGRGLPSDLINAILTTSKGHIWVATDEGVAWSTDHGRRWNFLRGANWAAKDAGLVHPPSPTFIRDAAQRVPRTGTLSSDYCTAMALAANGDIIIGHRRTGVDIVNPHTGYIWRSNPRGKKGGLQHLFVDAILLRPEGKVVLGCYGGGLEQLPPLSGVAMQAGKTGPQSARMVGAHRGTRFPAAAAAPTAGELSREKRQFAALVARLAKNRDTTAVALDTDWRTEGNWLGRYGTYFADLCAMISPNDLFWGAGWRGNGLFIEVRDGRHVTRQLRTVAAGDVIRRWIQTLYCRDRRMLELPRPYLDKCFLTGLDPSLSLKHRGAEWDDHGEGYPPTWQGPGIFFLIHIPPGLFRLAIYTVNMDGHSGPMRFRDYTLDISRAPQRIKDTGFFSLSGHTAWPALARRRVENFWGGVWIPFVVRGPVTLCVHLGRNYSLNTMISAVTLSFFNLRPMPYCGPFPSAAEASQFFQRSLPPARGKGAATALDEIPLGFGAIQRLPQPPMEIAADAAFGQIIIAAAALRREMADGSVSGGRKVHLSPPQAARQLWLLHRFRRAETLLDAAGQATPRRIELSLRWDGVDGTDAKDGYLVGRYLRRHRAHHRP